MYDLQQIRKQLEATQYKTTASLFELRVVLMNAGTLLTSRHLANQRVERDLMTSKLLLLTFRNVKHYYHILETTSEEHEACFNTIRELAIQDFAGLYKKLRTSNVVNLAQEHQLLSAAR